MQAIKQKPFRLFNRPGNPGVTVSAFFVALDDVADGQQAVVGAVALAAIRDELKGRRVKIRGAAAAAKATPPAKRKVVARAKVAAARGAKKAAPAKRALAAAGKRAAVQKTPGKKAAVSKARQPKQADLAVFPVGGNRCGVDPGSAGLVPHSGGRRVVCRGGRTIAAPCRTICVVLSCCYGVSTIAGQVGHAMSAENSVAVRANGGRPRQSARS